MHHDIHRCSRHYVGHACDCLADFRCGCGMLEKYKVRLVNIKFLSAHVIHEIDLFIYFLRVHIKTIMIKFGFWPCQDYARMILVLYLLAHLQRNIGEHWATDWYALYFSFLRGKIYQCVSWYFTVMMPSVKIDIKVMFSPLSVGLSVCLFVRNIAEKQMNGFSLNFQDR